MKRTDFAGYLTEFLTIYLPGLRGLSENTIMSYRDTFRFVLIFAEDVQRIPAEKLSLFHFTAELVEKFLAWLESERSNSISTRNQRLAAIHAFVRFVKLKRPEYLLESQKILAITSKRVAKPCVEYLRPESVKAILSVPDLNNKFGRRDLALLVLLYDCAARVQEVCDLRVGDVRLQKPYTITLTGKGMKTRVAPIMKETADILMHYLSENHLDAPEKKEYPLFCNHQRQKLTRAGVTYILKKYSATAREANAIVPDNVSPHMFRHSKAMHLLQAGVNLIYIRDFLGHAHVDTTEVYARADTEMKRAAIEKVSLRIDEDLPDWTEDMSLMSMLRALSRSN